MLKIFFTILLVPILMQFRCWKTICKGDLNEGEFNINMREFGNCNRSMSGTSEIKVNIQLHRKSRNKVLFFGNFTNTIPIDDNLRVELMFLRFHNERRYQKFPLTFKLAKACSDAAVVWGRVWVSMFRNEVNKCPIPEGVHVLNQVNLEQMVKHKSLFLPTYILYGRYKIYSLLIKKKKEEVAGCVYAVLEFKPDWRHLTAAQHTRNVPSMMNK